MLIIRAKHPCSVFTMMVTDKVRKNWKMKTKETHFLCEFSNFIWWKTKKQGNREHNLLWLYNLNNFIRLSHSSSFVLTCFIYSLGTYFKVKSSFRYYDLITFPVLLLTKTVILIVIPFDLLVIIYVFKYLRQRINT